MDWKTSTEVEIIRKALDATKKSMQATTNNTKESGSIQISFTESMLQSMSLGAPSKCLILNLGTTNRICRDRGICSLTSNWHKAVPIAPQWSRILRILVPKAHPAGSSRATLLAICRSSLHRSCPQATPWDRDLVGGEQACTMREIRKWWASGIMALKLKLIKSQFKNLPHRTMRNEKSPHQLWSSHPSTR